MLGLRHMRAFVVRSLSIALILSGAGCRSGISTSTPTLPSGGTHVLFIGNSLTYVNDLPGMVVRLARLSGNDTLHAAMVAYPDFSLEDHWNDGTARRLLAERRWAYVVMQQGSSALPESQIHLSQWAQRFAPVVRQAGAEPVLFMVWPFQTRLFDFQNVRLSYRNAAATIGAIFAPGGDGWPAYGDYGVLYADGLHATPLGSYIAALTILARVTGTSPEGLPPTIPGWTVDSTTVRALQRAAATALARNPSRPAGVP